MNSLSVEGTHGIAAIGRLGDDAAAERVMIRAQAGEPMRTRRSVEPGELFVSKGGYRGAWPYTPSGDERILPVFGKPTPILPVQAYPGSYPHGWISYEDMKMDVSSEMGPTPSGWVEPNYVSSEKAAAKEWAMPFPWSAPENQSRDVSGLGLMSLNGLGRFGRFHDFITAQNYAESRDFMKGVGADDSYETQIMTSQQESSDANNPEVQLNKEAAAASAIAAQATDAGKTAAAAGASPFDINTLINSVIKVGTTVAAGYLTPKAPSRTTTTVVSSPPSAGGSSFSLKSPVVIVGALGLLAVGAYAAFSGGGGGSGRGRGRRRSARRPTRSRSRSRSRSRW
jgi:hypothetical protein